MAEHAVLQLQHTCTKAAKPLPPPLLPLQPQAISLLPIATIQSRRVNCVNSLFSFPL